MPIIPWILNQVQDDDTIFTQFFRALNREFIPGKGC